MSQSNVQLDTSDFERRVEKLLKDAPEAVGAGLYAFGLKVMNTSKRKCPVDTGRLRASAFCASPREENGMPAVTCGHGTEYAPAVHEGTKHMAARKWFEKAIEAESGDAAKVIAKQAEKALQKGGGIAIRSGSIPETPQE